MISEVSPIVEVDLHGFYPWDSDLLETIESSLQDAWATGSESVTFIHGHGFNRDSYRPLFMNTNTGPLGACVRSHLRNSPDLRQFMYVKIVTDDCGATTVRIRPKG